MEELGVGWEMVDVPSDILLALQTGVRRERENIGTREVREWEHHRLRSLLHGRIPHQGIDDLG